MLCCVWCSSLLSLLLLLLPAADLPVVTAGQEVRCPEQQQSRGLLLRGVNVGKMVLLKPPQMSTATKMVMRTSTMPVPCGCWQF